ncbi:sulfatase [Carboxylicivirga marina]|uniref:sulfatase n=1 Tax=Carboxylicivirga marina TaxID=2800988 RepID=UPI002599F2B5|nr:sulfatase [uncultured Carboxylicivirga sp.]
MNKIKVCLFFILLALHFQISAQQNEVKNILFVIVDDLRVQAGVFGQDQMITPNLDKLGQEGVIFNRAYCQVPTCGASRASFMSGLYPTRERFVNYKASHDVDAPEVTSLPMWFKENGYTTISLGKVYHDPNDDVNAWSQKPFRAKTDKGWNKCYYSQENKELIKQGKKGLAYDKADFPDDAYIDGKVAKKAIETLQDLSKSEKPFFLAMGFQKPHLPFSAPAKYWDMYQREDIKLADNPFPPIGAPAEAIFKISGRTDIFNSTEIRNFSGIPKIGAMDDSTATTLLHGYYACVSYIDKLLGDVLSELERLDLHKNTAVVLIGDHGWHLGEHQQWGKHSLYDRVLKAPLIVKVPGKAANVKTNALAEYVDLYPTFCDLAGLELPEHLHGKSFVPVLDDPSKKHKEQVFARFAHGETIITDRFLYTEYVNKYKGTLKSKMLVDLKKDPKENENAFWKYEGTEILNELKLKLSKYQNLNHK